MSILLKFLGPWGLSGLLVLSLFGVSSLYLEQRDQLAQAEFKLELESKKHVQEISQFKIQLKACMSGRTNRDALVDCLRGQNCDG